MATFTSIMNLRKPATTDLVNVTTDIGANMDIIDAHAHSGTYVGRQAGTSGTVATLPFLNVKDYGALGDGSTNDTAAINAAIAALTPGATLYFPPGRYMTSGGHSISTVSVRIIGASGRAQTYNTSAQLYLRNGSNATMLTLAANTNQVTIRDLSLYGNYSNQTGTSNGLVIEDGCNYFLMDAVWVDSFHDDGWVIGQTTGTQSGTITNCESRVNQGYGMKFNAGATDTLVAQCYIDQNGLSGVYCAAADISFTGCHIWGNGTGGSGLRDGMTFASSSGCRVVNCYIESNTNGKGIQYATGTKNDHRVIGCDIWNNGTQGIDAFQVTNLLLSGNTIRQNNFSSSSGSNGAGVVLDGCTDFIVSANHFYGPSPFRQKYGYYELNACSNGLFVNNVCRAATHGTGDIFLSTTAVVPTIVRNNVGPGDAGVGAVIRTYATGDTQVNNSTTLVTVLSLAIKAGQTYVIRGAIHVDGSQAGDMKLRLQATSSTSATGWFGVVIGPAGSATSATAASVNPTNAAAIAASGGATPTAGLLGVGVLEAMSITGYLVAGSVDGTLEMQFAQQTADATNTTFHTGSWLELARVA